jgi:TonB-dependent receptor
MAVLCGGARAETGYDFNIPSEPLGKALTDYSRIASRQIVFSENLTAGKTVTGLSGHYTAEEALSLLLAGTGLWARSGPSGVLMVEQKAEITAPAPNPPVQNADTIEAVVVTGFAASLEHSTEEKRQSIGFIDSIFAEEVGKFPDTNLAESLNRIPGVTILREVDGSGTNVSIRGLGTNFTKVLLNGAQVLTSSTGPTNSSNANREVDLNIFPTELFTQLTVEKSARADRLEGGAAGVINLRSARPFDREGARLTYSLGLTDLSNQSALGPRGAIIASDTWGSFGALIGLSGQSTRLFTTGFESNGYTNPNLSAAQCTASPCNATGGGNYTIPAIVPPNVTTNGLTPGHVIDAAYLAQLNPNASNNQIDNGLTPRLGRPFMEKGVRSRWNTIVSLEYRATDALHLFADFVGGRITNAFDRADINWIGRNGAAIPTGLAVDANNVVTSGTFANAAWFLEARPYHERNDYLSINPGMEWDIAEKLHASFQLNASRSHFLRDVPSILVQTNTSAGNPAGVFGPMPPAGGVTVNYKINGGLIPPTQATNIDLNSPANFQWNGGRLNVQTEKRYTYTNGAHGDLRWGGDEINLQGGFAFDANHRAISGYDNSQAFQNAVCGDNPNIFLPTPNTQPLCQGINVPGSAAGVNGAVPGPNYPAYPGLGTGFTSGAAAPLVYRGSVIPSASLQQYLVPGPAGFINVDYKKFFADTNYAAFDYPNAPAAMNTNLGVGTGILDEKNYGLYLETSGRAILGGQRALRYNLGLRWVTTLQNISSPVSVADPRNAVAAAPADGGRYPNVLSFANTRHMYQAFLPSVNLVYEVSEDFKVRASLSRTMTRPDPNSMLPGLTFGDPSAAQASLGNPALKPYFSNNIDLGGELYTGGSGYIGVNVFRKGISGFTVLGTQTQPFSFLAQYGVTYATLTPTQQIAIDSRGGPNAASIVVQSATNAPGLLTINGIEVNWIQPLDFLLTDYGLSGFGAAANITIVDQKGSGAAPATALGISPFTYNLTGYYEHAGVSLRVSYVFNDTQVNSGTNQNGVCLPSTTVPTCPGGAVIYKSPYGQLDLSAGLRLSKLMGETWSDPEIVFDAQNLTKSKLRTYWQFPNVVGDYYRPGTTFLVSLRGTL